MSKPLRLISRLDIKGSSLIKGVHLEGLRVIGDPNEFARKYYHDGADEIIYLDIVATLYGRNKLVDIVKQTAKDIFVPMTVGGGVRSILDVEELLNAGADKIAINSAAVRNPVLISDIAKRFGSQCMVISIEAKQRSDDFWEVMIESGREKTNMCALEWVKKAEDYGAGEVLLTSIDKEGTMKGFDINLCCKISSKVSVPVIASGGFGTIEDLINLVKNTDIDGVAIASQLHYQRETLNRIKRASKEHGLNFRPNV